MWGGKCIYPTAFLSLLPPTLTSHPLSPFFAPQLSLIRSYMPAQIGVEELQVSWCLVWGVKISLHLDLLQSTEYLYPLCNQA